jgi:hypothetical protein
MTKKANTDRTDQKRPTTETTRIGRVERSEDSSLLGVTLFLSKSELSDLGVEVENSAVVAYWVENGELRISPPNRREAYR